MEAAFDREKLGSAQAHHLLWGAYGPFSSTNDLPPMNFSAIRTRLANAVKVCVPKRVVRPGKQHCVKMIMSCVNCTVLENRYVDFCRR